MSSTLRITVNHCDGLTAVSARGEADVAGAAALEQNARLAQDLPHTETVVIDLSELTFADSSIVEWLLRCDERAHRAATNLVVLAERGPVQRLLRLTAVDQRLRVVVGPDTVAA